MTVVDPNQAQEEPEKRPCPEPGGEAAPQVQYEQRLTAEETETLYRILTQGQTGHDFSQYKRSIIGHRISPVNGSLDVESVPGDGTRVVLVAPLQAEGKEVVEA